MGRLDGRVAVITGAGRGIGRATAIRFAGEGAAVVVNDVDADPANETVDAITGDGGSAVASTHDTVHLDQAEAMMAAAAEAFGSVDILVNNAGITHSAHFLDVTEAAFDRVMGVNVKGPFLCSQAAARRMIARERGSIINLSSGAWVAGIENLQAYSAAKAAIVGLTNSLARQLGPDNIRVNAIAPGAVLTERQLRLWMSPESVARIIEQQCLHE